MGARGPHARGMGCRVQSQGAEVRKTSKPGAPSRRQPGCRAILRHRRLCPEGRGRRSWIGALRISEGKDEAAPTIQHAVCWPRIPSTYPKDSNQSLRWALPNFHLQSHSFGLSSCWQAPPTCPARATPPFVLHSSKRESERGAEKSLTLSQGLGTPNLCTWYITPVTFWEKGVTSLSREVCKQD